MESCISDQFFDALARPALVTDCDGAVLRANKAFLAQFGVGADQIVGHSFLDIIKPVGNWKASGPEGRHVPFQTCDDAIHSVSGRLQINRYTAGQQEGFFVFADLQTAFGDQDLPGALSYLIEHFPGPILVWDKNARLLKYNAAAVQYYKAIEDIFYLGQDRQTLLRAALKAGAFGVNIEKLRHSVDEVLDLQYVAGVHKGPITNELETAEGKRYRVTAYFSPEGWGASIYEDITELRKVQSELSSQTRVFETILENVPDFVVVADRDYKITYVNPSFAELLGVKAEAFYGESCLRGGLNSVGREPIEALISAATPQDPSLEFDEWMSVASGKNIWVRWRAKVQFDGGKRIGLIKVGRDVTLEHERELNLRQQGEELRKKNESLEQFAAVVSHDLKAPLRHIAIFADMLIEDASKGKYAELMNYAKHVQNSAIRMDRVIRRLLEYSQLAYKSLSLQHVNLSDLVIQAVQNLETQIENARAEILASDLPDYYGDPDLLRQVFQNLIGNAVKYRRPGGRPRVRIYMMMQGPSLELCVEDNGIGVDSKYADSIFTAFRRLHKDESVYDGFGIGLALCKQIVESHQGAIWLDTTYNAGSRFVIRLPMQEKQV